MTDHQFDVMMAELTRLGEWGLWILGGFVAFVVVRPVIIALIQRRKSG